MATVESWPFGHLRPETASPAARAIAKADLSRYGDPLIIRELKRYLLLQQVLNREITMQSWEVDEAWHRFILDTVRYRVFCDSVFGKYFDHTSGHFEEDPSFPGNYRELFGEELPMVWFERRKRSSDFGDHNCA